MKWIEIIYKTGEKSLLNMANIGHLVLADNTIRFDLIGCNPTITVVFKDKLLAELYYSKTKAYCINYGPIPDVLVIGEEK